MREAVAHLRLDPKNNGQWYLHSLADHLYEVAGFASNFASEFNASEWGRQAGLWHDLGKYRPPFQQRIRRVTGYDPDAHIEGTSRPSHSGAGALHAIKTFSRRHGHTGEVAARVLAYVIASHHAGLYDWRNVNREDLSFRLSGDKIREEYEQALAENPPADILAENVFDPTPTLKAVLTAEESIPGAFALWVRMLFSALIDADFLDTERFKDPAHFDARGAFPVISELQSAYRDHMKSIASNATPTKVNLVRANVLSQCLEKAVELEPGAFSLTVPTGGGKTLASLGFALEHAHRYNKRRIIYAIPFTSIIEQTADVFRSAFKGLASDPVIEHHSQSDVDGQTLSSRLTCENWDAPLIVTTNVQLFESLFAARTSTCRKLHRLANSVIVLDEAQQLPPEFLQPILDVLRLLIAHYGVTVVFCTATQPVLSSRTLFDSSRNLRGFGAGEVREIVNNPDELFETLRRVRVRLPARLDVGTDWDTLAKSVAAQPCGLVITNRKSDARELWQKLPDSPIYLTTDLCGAHRSALIGQIRARLEARRLGTDERPLRVVSTSLVEAGVDLDFPIIWRSLAGLDALAQAAGRCNREGLLSDLGELVVFVAPRGEPQGALMRGANESRSVLAGLDDPHGVRLLAEREWMDRYFRRYYSDCPHGHDQHGIVDLLHRGVKGRNLDESLQVAFRSAAERFHLIDDEDTATVYVRYSANGDFSEIDRLLGPLQAGVADRWLMRKLQRYAVSVRRRQIAVLESHGEIAPVAAGAYVLRNHARYHPELGLCVDDEVPYSPADMAI